MRPKVVILTLAAALGLVGIMVVLKGVMGGHAGDAGGQPPGLDASGGSPSAATNVQVKPDSGNKETTSELSRAAQIEKELEQIRELQNEGSDDMTITPVLLAKVTHPEPEVRKAALEALVQLNDTNAVPGLEQAAESIKDPREKMAVRDAIEYLKLPGITDDASPESATRPGFTNANKRIPRDTEFNPNFIRGNKKGGRRNQGQQTVPPNPPAGQP
jgi:hypothetical protein